MQNFIPGNVFVIEIIAPEIGPKSFGTFEKRASEKLTFGQTCKYSYFKGSRLSFMNNHARCSYTSVSSLSLKAYNFCLLP